MPKTIRPSGLTLKQERFVAEYLIDANATRAAIAAGYSPRTAYRTGADMLQAGKVKAAIEASQKRLANRLEHSAEDVRREIERLAMFDPAALVGVKGPADIPALPEDVRRAIVGWTWDRQGRFTVKLSKESALDMLARIHGLYAADNKQKGELTVKQSPADMSDDELIVIARSRRVAEP